MADISTDLWRGVITGTVLLVIAGLTALVRWVHAIDKKRIGDLEAIEHRQWHVLRWIHKVGRELGVPFPLEDDIDDNDEWDEGLK